MIDITMNDIIKYLKDHQGTIDGWGAESHYDVDDDNQVYHKLTINIIFKRDDLKYDFDEVGFKCIQKKN